MQGSSSGGGPVHAQVPIHAHPQFSWRFMIFHREDVYHIIDNHQIDHIVVVNQFTPGYQFTPTPKFIQNNHS